MSISNSKNTIVRNKFRNYILAATAIGINLAVAYILIEPTAGDRPVADFQFPQNIDLGSKKVLNSLGLSEIVTANSDRSPRLESEPETIKASQKYQYLQGKSPISLEMSYIVNTRGNVATYLHQYTEIAPQAIDTKQLEEIKGIGHHTLLTNGDLAYLSSCISPHSLSNVTQKQFSQYRYQNDLKLSVGWEWLQGKASIRDRRCLWVHLSTPLTSDLKTTYQTLETAWQELYRWWLPNFPALTSE